MPSCFPILLCILLYFIFVLLSSLRRLEKLFGRNLFFNLRFPAAYSCPAFSGACHVLFRPFTPILFFLPFKVFLFRKNKSVPELRPPRPNDSDNRAVPEEKRLLTRFLSVFNGFLPYFLRVQQNYLRHTP